MKIPTFIMNQVAEVREVGTNGRGEPFDEVTFSSICRIEPQSKSVRRPDGTIVITSGFGTFPYDSRIEEGMVITCDGYTYEVIGVKPVPSFRGYSHKEVDLG